MTLNITSRFIITLLFCLSSFIGFSTVMGPVVIDIIGFDNNTNAIYFTRTDWSDCDCETDLYIYHIDKDSTEVIVNWSSRRAFSKNRYETIKNKGLENLVQLDTTVQPSFIILRWEEEKKYYSKVLLKETISCPFSISVFENTYKYYQCSKNSPKPELLCIEIEKGKSGLVLVKFQGDCYEGNMKESLIFYSKKDGAEFSKKLTLKDQAPLEFFEIKKK